jgi:hypothetical protein
MYLIVDVVRQMYFDVIWNFLKILIYVRRWTLRNGSGSRILL